MLRVWHALLIAALLLIASRVHAAPTYTITADKSELRPGDVVTMTHTVSPAASDAPASWTLKIPTMPGLTLLSASGTKGTLSTTATATSDSQTITSNTLTVYVAVPVPNPVDGIITVPVGILQGGGNAVVLTLKWQY